MEWHYLLGKTVNEFETSILYSLDETLSPWSSFVVMPIFAIANSGIAIDINSISTLINNPVSLGIIFGLVIGKQVGIFGVSYTLVKLKIAKLPSKVTKRHLYGASVLGGIGFTMSIFVSSLSFADKTVLSTAKISIMIASILSAILGTIVFKLIKLKSEKKGVIIKAKRD